MIETFSIILAFLILALQIYLLIGFYFVIRYTFNNDDTSYEYGAKAFEILLTWPWNRK